MLENLYVSYKSYFKLLREEIDINLVPLELKTGIFFNIVKNLVLFL